MKYSIICIFLILCNLPSVFSQTLNDAKSLYTQGNYEKALPIFEAEYKAKPSDPNLNHWYGVCLFETGSNMKKAEECLVVASKKNIQDSFYYLGQIYIQEFRFEEAQDSFAKYEELLTKKTPRKKKEELEKEKESLAELEEKRKVLSRLQRMVSNTEDIQIIDSLVVDKGNFLSAYKLSHSSGRLDYFNNVFSANKAIESVVYFNEKETKIYYSQPDKNKGYTLFSMEKLLDKYGNEKKLSLSNFGLTGDTNYPFVMPDGVTIYFSAKDVESIGGYDLFVSRYNMNNDTYLTPERLNMPFNSLYNDYMMVIDEEKGVGWFASDRYQPEGLVCIYTFIPNKTVTIVESENEQYLSSRARISSIKETWRKGESYSSLIALARKAAKEEAKQVRDFEFVIDNDNTYYKLADFKNEKARDVYYRVVQLRSEKNTLIHSLSDLRDTYSKSSDDVRRNMSAEILKMEKRIEALQKEIPDMEMQARNLEIQK